MKELVHAEQYSIHKDAERSKDEQIRCILTFRVFSICNIYIFIKYLFQVRDSQGVVLLVIIVQIIVCLQEMLTSTSALL